MKILILGGTGAIGNNMVSFLKGPEHKIFVTSRRRQVNDDLVSYLQGDAKDFDFLSKLLTERWDIIVDFMVYSTLEFKKRYSLLLNSTNQYIFISSARVYADSIIPIKENSPRLLDISQDEKYLSSEEYALTKARQEDFLLKNTKKNWTIVRPYITYDNERLQLGVFEKEDWLYRVINGRSLILSRDVQDKKTTLTAGKDVARALCALLGKDKALGEVFNITSDESVSWKEVSELYIKVLSDYGYEMIIKEQNLSDFLKWRQTKYQVIYDRMFNREFDNHKINQFIDTKEFTSFRVGLTESLENFLSNAKSNFKYINWKEQALMDFETDEYTNCSEIISIKHKIKYQIFRLLCRIKGFSKL